MTNTITIPKDALVEIREVLSKSWHFEPDRRGIKEALATIDKLLEGK